MGVYWNNNGKNGNSTIDIEDSFIISCGKKDPQKNSFSMEP